MKLAAVGAAALFAGLVPMQCAPSSSVTATVTMSTNGGTYAQVHVVGTANGSGANHMQAHGHCGDGRAVSGAVVTLSSVGETGDSFINCGSAGVADYGWGIW
jgi:hypothetical protein